MPGDRTRATETEDFFLKLTSSFFFQKEKKLFGNQTELSFLMFQQPYSLLASDSVLSLRLYRQKLNYLCLITFPHKKFKHWVELPGRIQLIAKSPVSTNGIQSAVSKISN